MIAQFTGDHRWLSNFWPAAVRWGLPFASVEHAFQAAKCICKEDMKQFQGVGPGQAKLLGRKVQLRSDWDAVKLRVMEYLLRQKFAARTELAAKLIATGNEELIEGNTWNDRFWGVCRGQGENHLGKLLMQIRKELSDI